MKNSILQNGNFTFETAGIKFSAVFSDALPSETGAVSIICAAENEVCVSADGKAFTVSENGVLVLSKNAEAKTERGKAAVFSVIAGKGEQEEEENLFPGQVVNATAILSNGKNQAEYSFPICLYPSENQNETNLGKKIEQYLYNQNYFDINTPVYPFLFYSNLEPDK